MTVNLISKVLVFFAVMILNTYVEHKWVLFEKKLHLIQRQRENNMSIYFEFNHAVLNAIRKALFCNGALKVL